MRFDHSVVINLVDIHLLVFGAGERICACIRDDEIDILEDLLLAVDNRLQLSCVITWENRLSSDDRIRMAEMSEKLSGLGFLIHHVEANLSNSFLIVDTTAVVFAEGAIENFVSDEVARVTSCVALFRELENRPEICDQIFLDKGLVPHPEEAEFDFRERIKPQLITLESLDAELIDQLAKSPKDLYQLTPRKFEELVARITERIGYEVELTPATGDGGRDIIAKRKDWTGRELLLIECKRYSSSQPVKVGIVRSLYGVIEHEEASRGLIVTTSYFSKGSVAFAQCHHNKIQLNDYTHLIEQLRCFANRV